MELIARSVFNNYKLCLIVEAVIALAVREFLPAYDSWVLIKKNEKR